MIPIILPGFIFMILNKKVAKRVLDISWYTTKEKILAWLCMPGYYGVMLYSIVVPLKLGTMWFYTGLVIYVAGFGPLIIAYFNNAATPSSEPVVKGVYKISRNPIYFFTALALLGVSIASASLLMMTLIILYSIFQHFIILGEERLCLDMYGEAYRGYMERMPRYL